MSPNEKFVMEALQSEFGGSFEKGEDPPDGYLIIGVNKIAVEVTRLVQKVKNESGNYVSRFEHDVPALKLADEINEKMSAEIPEDKYIFIVVPAPILKIRKTKEKLMSKIREVVNDGTLKKESIIEGNRVSINIYEGDRSSGKKIIGAVSNRYSSANIHENTIELLKDRISSKASKCSITEGISEYWLALYNDYWVADIETYRRAYRELDIGHQFSKILVVDSYGQVGELKQT